MRPSKYGLISNIDLLLDNVRVTALATAQAAQTLSVAAVPQADASISPQPAVLPATSLIGTPGAFTIRMTANQAGSYVLERSEDLQTWERVSEMQIGQPGPIEFHDPFTPGGDSPKVFYRIALPP